MAGWRLQRIAVRESEKSVYPKVADLYRGITRQGAPALGAPRAVRLRRIEAYLTVGEILPEASKGTDSVLWREFCAFGR